MYSLDLIGKISLRHTSIIRQFTIHYSPPPRSSPPEPGETGTLQELVKIKLLNSEEKLPALKIALGISFTLLRARDIHCNKKQPYKKMKFSKMQFFIYILIIFLNRPIFPFYIYQDKSKAQEGLA